MIKRNFYPLILIVIILFGMWQVAAAENKAAPPPPKVYAAAMSIPQAANPVVNELENTTGSTITITRQASGRYRILSTPPIFTVGRVIYAIEYHNMGPSITVLATMRCIVVDYCDIWVMSADPFGNSQYFYDGGTNGQFIPVRIEVYP